MNHEEATWEDRRASREEQERQRHDDEATKKREGLSWEGLAPARCLRYATREYTAVLAHVPLGFDALAECRNKTVNIHGRDLLPSRCEDQVGSYTQGSPGIYSPYRVCREHVGELLDTGMWTLTNLVAIPGGIGLTTR